MPSQPVPKAAPSYVRFSCTCCSKPEATELELHPEPEPLELIEPVPAAVATELSRG